MFKIQFVKLLFTPKIARQKPHFEPPILHDEILQAMERLQARQDAHEERRYAQLRLGPVAFDFKPQKRQL